LAGIPLFLGISLRVIDMLYRKIDPKAISGHLELLSRETEFLKADVFRLFL
jgi:hypothetical protein